MMGTLATDSAFHKPAYTEQLPLQRFVVHEPAGRYGISELLDKHLARKVTMVRGQHVLLDRDLAALHGVSLKRITAVVRAGAAYFEQGSILLLTPEERIAVRSRPGTAASGAVAPVHAFTELGILTVGLLLRTPRAMAFNLRIIRLFLRMRDVLTTNQDMLLRLDQLEKRAGGEGEDIQRILQQLKELFSTPPDSRDPAGAEPREA
jgi:ORF6N domain